MPRKTSAALKLRHEHWDPAFLAYCVQLQKKKPVIFCGDLNVAHTELDLANPKPNRGKKGFTDEEREGFQNFVDAGFVDTFRLFTQGNGHYSWWSHFANARARNIGWRIDYVLVSAALRGHVKSRGDPCRRDGQRPLPGQRDAGPAGALARMYEQHALVLPLRAALAQHRDAVLQAPPGAGKSTLVPLALLAEPWLRGRKILLLEPRRLAARAVAQRMASLLGERVGDTVGYRMRLDTRVSRATRIEVVTEGVLTRMLQSDPALEGVGCVIFDEFHERSLNADLGLALSLDARETLDAEFRILVMSATLDGERIGALLGAPVVDVPGRSFPVDIRYTGRGLPPLPGGVERPEVLWLQTLAPRAARNTTATCWCSCPGPARSAACSRRWPTIRRRARRCCRCMATCPPRNRIASSMNRRAASGASCSPPTSPRPA